MQNTYATAAERGLSVTDQRHRLAASWIWEPRLFHREHAVLQRLFNDWSLAGIITAGSGRPFNPRVIGDANQDGNLDNDRLPGAGRNSFTSPDYVSGDLRLSRSFHLSDRFTLEALAESFNVLNRNNQRFDISDDGFQNSAGNFVQLSKTLGANHYPAHFRTVSSFLQPTSAYAPRQIQIGIKLKF